MFGIGSHNLVTFVPSLAVSIQRTNGTFPQRMIKNRLKRWNIYFQAFNIFRLGFTASSLYLSWHTILPDTHTPSRLLLRWKRIKFEARSLFPCQSYHKLKMTNHSPSHKTIRKLSLCLCFVDARRIPFSPSGWFYRCYGSHRQALNPLSRFPFVFSFPSRLAKYMHSSHDWWGLIH